MNVGGIDRILRIVIGLALILGVLPLITGLFRFCPAYKLIGANTCPMKK